jgi:thiol-disulfide isomerase/thioredoxin
MTRTVRRVAAVALVVAVQGLLLGGYLLVEHRRSEEIDGPAELGTAPPRQVDQEIPQLMLRTREGESVELRSLVTERPTLVHLWATWCPPCRAELPGLLALPQRRAVDVVAIALDPEWDPVDDFLDGRNVETVLLGDQTEIESTLDVHALPVTFLIDAGGRLRLRFDGARDWTDEDFLESWLDPE